MRGKKYPMKGWVLKCSRKLREEQTAELTFCQPEHAASRKQAARGLIVLSHKCAR